MTRRKKLSDRSERVTEAWHRIENREPDISTERLMAMVADETGEDYGDIVGLLLDE